VDLNHRCTFELRLLGLRKTPDPLNFFPFPLLYAARLNFLPVDDHETSFFRVTAEHQTGAYAKAIDRAVAVHIDVRRVKSFSFTGALNAVKLKPPSSVR
jgi:hypothetical protein